VKGEHVEYEVTKYTQITIELNIIIPKTRQENGATPSYLIWR